MADDLELTSGAGTETPETPPVAESSSSPTEAGGETPPKKLSLRDELKKNFSEHREPSELRTRAPKAEKPAKEAKAAPEGERPRDETGKFLPKESVEAQGAPAEKPTVQDVQPAAASASVAGPPPGWSAESKAAYPSLPDPIKQDIIKREQEVSNGFKKYSDDARKYQEIEQVLAPVRSVYQQSGVQSDAQAIKNLLVWESGFRNPQTRTQAFQSLLQMFPVDQASFAQPNGQPSDSNAAAVAQYIQPISQQVNSLQGELARIQADRAASDIATFSKDKPYFEQVKTDMGQLMAQGVSTTLDDAYQRAIWANPSIRDEMVKKQMDDAIAKQKAEAAQRSNQAQRAAISPSTKAPAAPALNGKDKPKGVRGSILASIESLREERA